MCAGCEGEKGVKGKYKRFRQTEVLSQRKVWGDLLEVIWIIGVDD